MRVSDITNTHECPYPLCTLRVPRAMLACRPHWFALPAELRSAIWAAHKAKNTMEHARAIGAAMRWYRASA